MAVLCARLAFEGCETMAGGVPANHASPGRSGQSVAAPFEDEDVRRASRNADASALRKLWKLGRARP
eukprot:5516362-Pyramimonas_sp.AAC.1